MNKVATDILMRISKKVSEQANSAFKAANEDGISQQQRMMLKGKAKAYGEVAYFIKDTYGYAADFPIPTYIP